MNRSVQLALPLAPHDAYAAEDFLVADPNRQAVAWLERWPSWPAPALVLYGPPGCGKTHLAHMFAARAGARWIRLVDLRTGAARDLISGTPAVILDDVESVVSDEAEEPLFHLHDAAREAGRTLLLIGTKPPRQWKVTLADLRSRLLAAPSVQIGAPDDALIRAVLVKLFTDRQARVNDGVVSFLLARMERSFDAARRLVTTIDGAALATRRPITVPLVRAVLEGEEAGSANPS